VPLFSDPVTNGRGMLVIVENAICSSSDTLAR